MIDKEILSRLTKMERLLEKVLLKQDVLSKQISADLTMSAIQNERSLELQEIEEMAKKAIQKAASFNWATNMKNVGYLRKVIFIFVSRF